MQTKSFLILSVSTLLLVSCASVPQGEMAGISSQLERATGTTLAFDADGLVQRSTGVDALLEQPLSPEAGARIALANNPKVAAAFAQLGIERANFLQSIMPANPAALAEQLVARGQADTLKFGFGLDVMSLVTLPARRQSAARYWQGAKARALGETLVVAGQARSALIDYIAINQSLDLMSQANDTAQTALVAAEAIYAAGNSTRADLDRERLFAAEIGLAFRQAQANLLPARARVNAALGLPEDQGARWTSLARLPAPPPTAIDTLAAENSVITASADIAEAKAFLMASRALRATSGLSSLLPEFEVSTEQERDGVWKRGVGLAARLPFFGFGKADRLRALSSENLAQAQLASLQLDLRSEAKAAAALAEATRQVAIERRETILPLSAEVFSGAQLNFNAMQIGIFQLLEAKRLRLDAGRQSIQATRDYWLAQANLDLLMQGGRPPSLTKDGDAIATDARQLPSH